MLVFTTLDVKCFGIIGWKVPPKSVGVLVDGTLLAYYDVTSYHNYSVWFHLML